MKNAFILLTSFALVAVMQLAPAGAATSTLKVTLDAQNGSGETGTATLTQVGSDVQVVIALKGAPTTAQPAHIHNGVCSDLGGVDPDHPAAQDDDMRRGHSGNAA